MALELVLPGGAVTNPVTNCYEVQTGGPAVVNPTIVDRSNDFQIVASWNTSGLYFASLNPAFTWEGEAIFEQMGLGEFGGGPFTATTPYIQTSALQNYSLTINILPGQVPVGVYRVILKVRFVMSGTTTTICGFDDLGLVEFYN